MKWEELIEEKKKKMWIRYRLLDPRREIKNREQDNEKEKLLIKMDYMRMKRMIATGEFKILGNRRYRLRL